MPEACCREAAAWDASRGGWSEALKEERHGSRCCAALPHALPALLCPHPGVFTILLGPPGSGKTTLLQASLAEGSVIGRAAADGVQLPVLPCCPAACVPARTRRPAVHAASHMPRPSLPQRRPWLGPTANRPASRWVPPRRGQPAVHLGLVRMALLPPEHRRCGGSSRAPCAEVPTSPRVVACTACRCEPRSSPTTEGSSKTLLWSARLPTCLRWAAPGMCADPFPVVRPQCKALQRMVGEAVSAGASRIEWMDACHLPACLQACMPACLPSRGCMRAAAACEPPLPCPSAHPFRPTCTTESSPSTKPSSSPLAASRPVTSEVRGLQLQPCCFNLPPPPPLLPPPPPPLLLPPLLLLLLITPWLLQILTC